MSEVRKWLEAINLSQYADAFEANDIEIDLLEQLDDQTLKDIGVMSAGHRLRIRNAITKLNPAVHAVNLKSSTKGIDAPPTSRREDQSQAQPAEAKASGSAGERRYLAVMFCDLVGSTGISAQLDAEEWRDLVGSYVNAASAAVTDMGGHVAKKLGDGILALFGYPLADENDAGRAALIRARVPREIALDSTMPSAISAAARRGR